MVRAHNNLISFKHKLDHFRQFLAEIPFKSSSTTQAKRSSSVGRQNEGNAQAGYGHRPAQQSTQTGATSDMLQRLGHFGTFKTHAAHHEPDQESAQKLSWHTERICQILSLPTLSN